MAGVVPIADFEIKVFASGESTPIGVGSTGGDGSFHLVLPRGEGAMLLHPGEYAFTLEPFGPESPKLSKDYASPLKTPLKLQWKLGDTSLDLKIPAIK
jgi:hypothetical protein